MMSSFVLAKNLEASSKYHETRTFILMASSVLNVGWPVVCGHGIRLDPRAYLPTVDAQSKRSAITARIAR